MKKPAPTSQYTLRNVPPHVDRALRKIAASQEQSLNQLILDTLELLVGTTQVVESPVFHDLDSLIGSWVEDSDFDESLLAQGKIDSEMWK